MKAYTDTPSPVLGVVYDESDPASYEAVTIRLGNGVKRFGSGDPVQDWAAAWASLRLGGWTEVACSSSVDHFLSDGGVLEVEPTAEEIEHAAVVAARDATTWYARLRKLECSGDGIGSVSIPQFVLREVMDDYTALVRTAHRQGLICTRCPHGKLEQGVCGFCKQVPE